MDTPLRLFLVDDQELVRAGFAMVLDAQTDMEVVGEAPDGQSALDRLPAARPDVVLMDIRMPRLDGIEATRRLMELPDPPKVIVLTTFDLDEYVYQALRAGAAGFLLKDAGPAELLAAVRAVAGGEAVIAPSTTRRLLERFVPLMAEEQHRPADPRRDPRLAALTARELEVMEAVGQGWSNQEIAERFFLAEATVKTHIGRILAKLGARDRVQIVIIAYETGLAGR